LQYSKLIKQNKTLNSHTEAGVWNTKSNKYLHGVGESVVCAE